MSPASPVDAMASVLEEYTLSTTRTALRAYSISVNVPATKELLTFDPLKRVTAFRQFASCPADTDSAAGSGVIDRGTYIASWLVLKGGSESIGGQRLASDVLEGVVVYMLAGAGGDTFIVAAGAGSQAEQKARDRVKAKSSEEDVFLLVATLQDFNNSFSPTTSTSNSSSNNTCSKLASIITPFAPAVNSSSSLMRTIQDSVEAQLLMHVWAYSGSSSATISKGERTYVPVDGE
jgi:hypothetical protein